MLEFHYCFELICTQRHSTQCSQSILALLAFRVRAQWVKIAQKVSFYNWVSEASNMHTLELWSLMRLFWWIWTTLLHSQWLKITQKVSFYKIASEEVRYKIHIFFQNSHFFSKFTFIKNNAFFKIHIFSKFTFFQNSHFFKINFFPKFTFLSNS